MKSVYIESYINNKQLKASISLLHSHILGKSTDANLTKFAIAFSRIADRVLYHSVNIFEKFEILLSSNEHAFGMLESDEAYLCTFDTSAKYEIEAYLAAAKCLFESNFVGIQERKKTNLLGKVIQESLGTKEALITEFTSHKSLFEKKANKVRNDSIHVNKKLVDIGVPAHIKRSKDIYVITIPNVYQDDKGASLDLHNLFIDTASEINQLITKVRDILINHCLKYYPPPSNTYQGVMTKYENANVELSKNGFKYLNYKNNKLIT